MDGEVCRAEFSGRVDEGSFDIPLDPVSKSNFKLFPLPLEPAIAPAHYPVHHVAACDPQPGRLNLIFAPYPRLGYRYDPDAVAFRFSASE